MHQVVEVHILPEEISASCCVMIDVLRATSSIVAALAAGASFVKPASSIEQALSMKSQNIVVAGERNSVKPPGFDLGNSPAEFAEQNLKGKGVVLTTTNGTAAIEKLNCQTLLAASFLNLTATLEYLKKCDHIHVVCAGSNGKFSLEDFLLAGYIASLDPDPKDAAAVAKRYAQSVSDILNEIKKSFHACHLKKLGFERDIAFSAQKDIYNFVAVLKNGVFVKINI